MQILTLNAPSRTWSIVHTTWVVRWGCGLEFSTQRRPGLRSEVLGAASEISEKLGAVGDLESCRGLLRWTEEEINTRLPYISTASS